MLTLETILKATKQDAAYGDSLGKRHKFGSPKARPESIVEETSKKRAGHKAE